MEVENLTDSVEVFNDADSKIICSEFFNDFQEYSQKFELSRVYQLNVEKLKYHLTRLQDSISIKRNRNESNSKVTLEQDETNTKQLISNLSDELVIVTKYKTSEDQESMAAILQETCGLVCKLEMDRSRVEEEIEHQKRAIKDLMTKISSLARFRLETLPSVVQKEHETCISDISELHWHIQHRTGVERRLRHRRDNGSEINTKMREEISGIVERIPLVHEKLEMEKVVMEKISNTKIELTAEAEASKERLRATIDKEKESNHKVEAERQHIKRDLNAATKGLNKIQKALQHGIKEFSKLEDFKARCENKILQNNQNIEKANLEISSKKREKEGLEEEIDRLERQERELKFDNRRIKENRNKKKEEFEELTKKHNEYVEKKEAKKKAIEHQMVTIKRENQQMELEIETMRKAEELCLQETEKLKQKSLKAKEDTKIAENEFSGEIEIFGKISKNHAEISQKLEEENRRLQQQEDKLRKSLNNVEQLIKQEILAKANFQAKIQSDSGELEKMKEAIILKEKQMKKLLRDTQKMLKDARDKVSQIESVHQESSTRREKWESEQQAMLDQQEAIRTKQGALIAELTPAHTDLTKRLNILIQKEEHIDWQVKTMNSQLLEIDDSGLMISKSKKKLQDELLGLERENHRLTVEVDSLRRSNDKINDMISQLQTQEERLRKTHSNYMEKRTKVFENLTKEFKDLLIVNKTWATEYRKLQMEYFLSQDSYLNESQRQIWMEEIKKNYHQTERLQHHMQNNLEANHFMKLILDNEKYLELQKQNQINQTKVKEIDERLKIISTCFPNQVDQINS